MSAEERAEARDEAAQERAGAAAHLTGVLSPGYVQCEAGMHPDHGDAVVYPPGQLLPGWVAAALATQRPEPDRHGVYRLAVPTKPGAKR
jgi:hypothetical protein